jgi:hypothetical protein
MRKGFIQILKAGACIGLALSSVFASAQISAISLIIVSRQTTPISGETVQDALNAAIAAGQPSYTLPPNPIDLTTSLMIPKGTKDFMLIGANGTSLRRASASDFPLLVIGDSASYALDNFYLNKYPQMNILPVAEGATVLTRTGGANPVTGWYALVGTHATDDVVRHSSGSPTFHFRRELIRVISVQGQNLTLAQGIGRDFLNPQLRLVQADSATTKEVTENITVRNVTLFGRSTVNNSLSNKILMCSLGHNISLDDVSVQGFNTAGISFGFSKGIFINRARVSDGNRQTLGYGIEIAGSRNVTIRNSTFSTHRWGVIYQSGAMDALVEDCTFNNGSSSEGFDVGHGFDEKRLTYRRVIAPVFSIGNPSWRRGNSDTLLEDCTATSAINFYGNIRNVTIRGRHPSQTYTTPLFNFFTEGGGSGIPAGVTYPISVIVENGNSRRSVLDGVNTQMISMSSQAVRLGTFTARNWTFENNVTSTGAAIYFRATTVPTQITLENSTVSNKYEWNGPIALGPVSGTGSWNLNIRNTKLLGMGPHSIVVQNGAPASVLQTNSTFKGLILDSSSVSGATVTRGN